MMSTLLQVAVVYHVTFRIKLRAACLAAYRVVCRVSGKMVDLCTHREAVEAIRDQLRECNQLVNRT